jgi:hypothetical protein
MESLGTAIRQHGLLENITIVSPDKNRVKQQNRTAGKQIFKIGSPQ